MTNGDQCLIQDWYHLAGGFFRQELACELQVAVELQGRLAKVRSEVEATRRSIDLELREAAAAKAKLLEAYRWPWRAEWKSYLTI